MATDVYGRPVPQQKNPYDHTGEIDPTTGHPYLPGDRSFAWNEDMPQYPGYTPGLNQGLLDMYSNIRPDSRGMDQYRKEALRTGPSPWANLQNQQLDVYRNKGLDQLSRGTAGEAAGARTQLAMRGGLDSGARERVAKSAARNYLDLSQGLRGDVQGQRLGIASTDEANRQKQLGALPGMEVAWTAPELDKAKTQATWDMQERQAQNSWNMNLYNQQMAAWAAAQQADAIRQSGNQKSGIFGWGTGIF